MTHEVYISRINRSVYPGRKVVFPRVFEPEGTVLDPMAGIGWTYFNLVDNKSVNRIFLADNNPGAKTFFLAIITASLEQPKPEWSELAVESDEFYEEHGIPFSKKQLDTLKDLATNYDLFTAVNIARKVSRYSYVEDGKIISPRFWNRDYKSKINPYKVFADEFKFETPPIPEKFGGYTIDDALHAIQKTKPDWIVTDFPFGDRLDYAALTYPQQLLAKELNIITDVLETNKMRREEFCNFCMEFARIVSDLGINCAFLINPKGNKELQALDSMLATFQEHGEIYTYIVKIPRYRSNNALIVFQPKK